FDQRHLRQRAEARRSRPDRTRRQDPRRHDRAGAEAMRIDVGAATDVGRVRQGNEDGYLVSAPLYVVADGMGGHRGGEVASGLALETLEDLYKRQRGSLVDQVKEANR